jgi:hypothetical protein
MKHSTLYPMLVALVLCTFPIVSLAAKVGEAAPEFKGTASDGKMIRLFGLSRKVCSSRVAQQRVSLRRQAVQQR